MFAKLSEAIRLLTGNFLLISLLVLTVCLPGNVVINYLMYFVLDPDDWAGVLRASTWIEGIFGPIYLGAMVYAFVGLVAGLRKHDLLRGSR